MKGIIERIERLQTPKMDAKLLFMNNLNRFIRTFYHKRSIVTGVFDIDYMKYGINFMKREIDKASPKDIQDGIDIAYDFVKELEENGYKKSKT